MDRNDRQHLDAATRQARAALDALDLTDNERAFAEQAAKALLKAWIDDGSSISEIRRRRLRPRTVPAVFAYALAGAVELHDYAKRRYPSRGA